MSSKPSNSKSSPDENLLDRRGNPRRATLAVFTIRVSEDTVLGAGRDLSKTGAYFITSDELACDVKFEIDGKEVSIGAKIRRIDPLSPGSIGIALEFDRQLLEEELPPTR